MTDEYTIHNHNEFIKRFGECVDEKKNEGKTDKYDKMVKHCRGYLSDQNKMEYLRLSTAVADVWGHV